MPSQRHFLRDENFARRIYAWADEAVAHELDRLQRSAAGVASCRAGCCHCCRYHILINVVEAQTLALYVQRKMTPVQIHALQARTKRWHQWNDSGPGRYPADAIGGPADFSGYRHFCPLLVDGRCSAYPARPLVCRAHFVSSSPALCRAANDPQTTADAPAVLMEIAMAIHGPLKAIQERIEAAGMEFSRSQMLLPHWLAVQMGWGFAVQAP
jgi:Fe-S-cluster containining protein